MYYAICEIGGKQYKIIPGKPIEVDRIIFSGKNLKVKALVISDGQLKIGNPYLKDELELEVLEEIKLEKIRVGKYHSKSNQRRVTGQRPKKTRVVLNVKK